MNPSEPQRYSCRPNGDILKNEEGDYIKHKDFLAFKEHSNAECEKLREHCKKLQDMLMDAW